MLCSSDQTPQVKPRVEGCEPRQPRQGATDARVPHTWKVLSAGNGEPPTGHTCGQPMRHAEPRSKGAPGQGGEQASGGEGRGEEEDRGGKRGGSKH